MKKLTENQKKTCDIILLMELSGRVNHTKAYQMVYGSKKKTAEAAVSRMLRNVKVLAYLARARARVKRVVERTEDEIIARYQDLGWADFDDYGSWDVKGLKVKSSKQIPKDKMGAIKSITMEEKEYTNKKGRKGVTRQIKLELHNPKAAVDSLAKIKGMMLPGDKEVMSFALAMHEAMKDKENENEAKDS
jgi:hypothetical protein